MKCEKPHTETVIGEKLQEARKKFNDRNTDTMTGNIWVHFVNKYCKNPTG